MAGTAGDPAARARACLAAHPLLDLRLLRLPGFTTANVVAFCSYFATFAIFFFAALYLDEVAGYSGYQIAQAFLPMTVLMILASLLAGRWTSVAGLRASIVSGCLVFGAGLLATNAALSPRPHYLPLAAALALTGIGIGTTVVPITSSVLAAVPSRHSSMAASAANTSREIGAVTGVAVLGALVSAQLKADLASRLRQLGIPPAFQSVVINALETGRVPPSGKTAGAGGAAAAGQGTLVREVIYAAPQDRARRSRRGRQHAPDRAAGPAGMRGRERRRPVQAGTVAEYGYAK